MTEIYLAPPVALREREANASGEHPLVKVSPLLFRDVRRIREGISEAIFTLSHGNNTGEFYSIRKHFNPITTNVVDVPDGMTAKLQKITVLRKVVEPGKPFGSERTGAWHTDKPDNIDIEVLVGEDQPTGFIYGTDSIPDKYAGSRSDREKYLNSFPSIEELLNTHNFSYIQAMPYQAMQTNEHMTHIAPVNLRPERISRDVIVAGYKFS